MGGGQSKYFETNESKLCSGRNEKKVEIRECLLYLGAESGVFQLGIQKYTV
jgi:hypothetical protein